MKKTRFSSIQKLILGLLILSISDLANGQKYCPNNKAIATEQKTFLKRERQKHYADAKDPIESHNNVPPVYRLGDKVIPSQQSVFLKLDPSKDDLSGKTNIVITVKKATNSIRFNAVDIRVTSAHLVKDNQRIPLTVQPSAGGIQSASTEKTLEPGEYQLELEFAGPYNRQSVGLYKTFEQGIPYLFSQFEFTDARRAFPLFDEPIFKIPFQLTISAPKGQQVYSNTPEISRYEEGDWITYEFASNPPISSYLVALAVGPFEKIPVENLSLPGQIITTKGKIEQAKYAAQITPAILKTLEDYFGIPYPYKKLDQIAAPEFRFGAMENPGLVVYRDNTLLLNEKTAPVTSKSLTAGIIAHELAHQWYGNLVTMKWWDDLWLNEAFATWMAAKVVNQLYPEFEQELKLPQNAVMTSDAKVSTNPIRKPIKTEDDINDGLKLAYQKGQSVLSMVEEWIGQDTFQQGMRQYMNKYRWGNAEAADLWNTLSEVSGKDVAAVLKSFTEQSGYPLLTIKVQGNNLEISQQRFANAGVDAPPQTWTLPVFIRYGAGDKEVSTKVLLDQKTTSIKLDFEPEWIFPDAQGISYSRWQFSGDYLTKLLENKDQLSNAEKLALQYNINALLRAGVLPVGEIMASASLFLGEEHPLVVKQAIGMLKSMKQPLVNSDNRKKWQKFIVNSVPPAAKRFGLTSKENDSFSAPSLRGEILSSLALDGKDLDIIKIAQEKAQQFLKAPETVDQSLAPTYMFIAGYYGDLQFFEDVKNAFIKTSAPFQRRILLNTLGSFNEPNVQEAAMNFVLSDDNVNASDFKNVIASSGVPEARRKHLQKWVFENYNAIIAKMRSADVPFLPLLIGRTCDKDQLKELQDFFNQKASDSEAIARTVEQMTEGVNDCINLKQREQKSFDSYLKKFLGE